MAAARWLAALADGSVERAFATFGSDPAYADLTMTQYRAALDWLRGTGLESQATALRVAGPQRDARAALLVLEHAIVAAEPLWLDSAPESITSIAELPLDVADAAAALGVEDTEAFAVLRAASGKVDTAARAASGLAAEIALVTLLTRETAATVEHVAATQDGLGYDIRVRTDRTLHLEVKGTVHRNALTIYLSRNEHDVMLVDPDWHLVAALVGPAPDRSLQGIGTVDRDWIKSVAPLDRVGHARWESVRLTVPPSAVRPGIPPLVSAALPGAGGGIARGRAGGADPPRWLPVAASAATG